MTSHGGRETHGRARRSRHLAWILAVGLAAAAVEAGAQGDRIVVEDWSAHAEGTRGVPPGWATQSWGSPKYDFSVVTDGASRVLRLRSAEDSSTMNKELKIDVKQYPILQWRWKVVELPKGGDARRKETDDEAAQLYVTFPRFPTAVRSRIIGYIWDTTAPAGTTFGSKKVGTVTFIVVRSGEADLGKWFTETRNVLEDYKRIYGDAPGEDVGAVSLSINSQNTKSRAEAFFGEILFKRP